MPSAIRIPLPATAFAPIHPEWTPLVEDCLDHVDGDYLAQLNDGQAWLPGMTSLFNAFSIPLSETHTLLLGESPYPRIQSANGFAFWDAAVDGLWSDKGLSKQVNRATSLRNFIKMLLHAEGLLDNDFSQSTIAQINKSGLVSSIDQLFKNCLNRGFLLLNSSLVLSSRPMRYDAKAWQPFIIRLLALISETKPDIKLLLFGRIAQDIHKHCPKQLSILQAEHPYNISFINNPDVLKFFAPLHLLKSMSSI